MGARDYSPERNRFLTRDLYNGALADLSLGTDVFTMNRYAFAGGNPITMIEIDGHLFGMSWSDVGHAALDVVGLVPVVGEAADLANAAWYAAEGDYLNASLSAAAAIPFAGYAATGAKLAIKGADVVRTATRSADEIAGAGGTAARTTTRTPDGVKTPDSKPPTTGAPATKPTSTPAAKPPPPSAPAKVAPSKAPAGNACKTGNSFTPDTPVLLADGTSRPIAAIKVGDLVLAADPVTGESGPRPVTALIVGEGTKALVDITVDTDGAVGEASGTITATDGHPFWVQAEHRWVDAEDLRPGTWLRTSAGTYVQITAVRAYTAHQRVHNLTIADLHTYHVLTGTQPVLVHNCNPTDVAAKHGGEAVEGGFRFPTHRAARQAASEMVGNMGSRTRAIRAHEFRGGPFWMRNSSKKIGRRSADNARGYRDDFLGHQFPDGKTMGPHLNVWAPHLPGGIHLFYPGPR